MMTPNCALTTVFMPEAFSEMFRQLASLYHANSFDWERRVNILRVGMEIARAARCMDVKLSSMQCDNSLITLGLAEHGFREESSPTGWYTYYFAENFDENPVLVKALKGP